MNNQANPNEARTDAISKAEAFMGIASLMKQCSKDPSTQVGACIVDKDNRILSVGFNGTPNGFDDAIFPWGKTSDDPLETKYPYVVHAERNAILHFRGSFREFSGATLYVTHFPCNECAKEIIQCGIKHVVFLHDYDSKGMSAATLRMFAATGVTYEQFPNPSFEVQIQR